MNRRDLLNVIAGGSKETTSHYKIVAVIMRGGSVLAVGRNSNRKTHPVYFNGEYDRCIHAEFDAIRQARAQTDSLRGAKMFVLRMRKADPFGNSKPCVDCMKIIAESGLKSVHFMEDGVWKKISRKQM